MTDEIFQAEDIVVNALTKLVEEIHTTWCIFKIHSQNGFTDEQKDCKFK